MLPHLRNQRERSALEFLLVRRLPRFSGNILEYESEVSFSLRIYQTNPRFTSVALSLRGNTQDIPRLFPIWESVDGMLEALTNSNLTNVYTPPYVQFLLANAYLQIDYTFLKLSGSDNVV